MEVNKILNADILDIIFEGRNKEYGAYDLRKTYNKRLVTFSYRDGRHLGSAVRWIFSIQYEHRR